MNSIIDQLVLLLFTFECCLTLNQSAEWMVAMYSMVTYLKNGNLGLLIIFSEWNLDVMNFAHFYWGVGSYQILSYLMIKSIFGRSIESVLYLLYTRIDNFLTKLVNIQGVFLVYFVLHWISTYLRHR